MREVVLDTETTGLDPATGDRIVEIGCVELVNHIASGRTFHCYINPEREMPAEAFAVHGLSTEFLAGHPVFADLADAFHEFIGEAPLVIHNAEFDIRFLDAEMARLGRPAVGLARTVDTLTLARQRFPGAQANLDALCRRFQIDLSDRSLHGALLDAQLLAQVYLELIGGRQPGLELASAERRRSVDTGQRKARPPRQHAASAEEAQAHARFLEKLTDPVWTP